MLQFLQPFISSYDGFFLSFIPNSCESLLRSMVHDLGDIVRIDGIEDVEEIFSIGSSFVCIFILEVDVEVFIILEVLPKVLDTELIPAWDMDEIDLILFEQLLIVPEDAPQEVLVHLALRWQIVLQLVKGKSLNGGPLTCLSRQTQKSFFDLSFPARSWAINSW